MQVSVTEKSLAMSNSISPLAARLLIFKTSPAFNLDLLNRHSGILIKGKTRDRYFNYTVNVFSLPEESKHDAT